MAERPKTEQKHTPGPWRIEEDWAAEIYGDDHSLIAKVVYPKNMTDARLIASAPALLAALKAIINSDMAMREEDEGRTSPELDAARAAIKSATGEDQ